MNVIRSTNLNHKQFLQSIDTDRQTNNRMKVEVFATDIRNSNEANIISGLLHLCFPNLTANVDLDDTDKVLRIESRDGRINVNDLINYVKSLGYQIRLL